MTTRVAKEEIAILMPSRLTHYFTDDREDLPQGEEGSIGGGFGGLFARLRTWLAARRANEEAVAELARLSDHELADIGLVRSDLLRVSDPGFASSYNAERFAAGAYGVHPEHAHG
ncbi:MAG: DUF1127 domain-containing protein [Rhodospirillales bacterium]|nr:DUF1127 domain-containing protein [Rhodospirillales bacterium]